jgi:hypothetical protein
MSETRLINRTDNGTAYTLLIVLGDEDAEDVRVAQEEEHFNEKMLCDYIMRLALGRKER